MNRNNSYKFKEKDTQCWNHGGFEDFHLKGEKPRNYYANYPPN